MTSTSNSTVIDETDRRILAVLAEDPRVPYSDISETLAEDGIELSSEAIRRRVSSLLEITTSFFLLRPDTHEWEIVLITVQTEGGTSAKTEAFEAMSEMNFWFVGSGFGTVDLYAHATVSSTAEVDRLVNDVREINAASKVDYFIETERAAAVERYLQVE
jgi:hypothetical protein